MVSITNPIIPPNIERKKNITGIDNNLYSGKFKILFANRLTFLKGIDRIPKIIKILKKDITDFIFIVCGSGKYPDEIFEGLNDKDIKNHILFLGYQDNIYDLMSYVDISIRLDRGETAGGKSIYESMFLNKPVIVGSTKAHTKWFTHLKDIYFVEDRTAVEFSKAILFLKNNKNISRRIADSAQKNVYKNWNMNIFIEKFISLCYSFIKD